MPENKEEIPLPKLLEAVLSYQTSVYVTVLNIIQCIALAFLINEARDTIMKEEASFKWLLRSTAALAVILVVWERYVSELQYLWLVSWFDTLIPFFIGIIECWIVFSTNAKAVSLNWFILSIAFLQAWVALGYWYAYRRRRMKITEELYQAFYSDYHRFVFRLTNFLKDYDWWHVKVFVVASTISFAICVFVILFPFNFNEIVFPAFYLFELVRGEFMNNFHKALHKDKSVGLYFKREEKKS